MSENTVFQKYSRHIDTCRYFVRESVAGGVLTLIPLRADLMADALTKALPTPAHVESPFCDDGTHTFLRPSPVF